MRDEDVRSALEETDPVDDLFRLAHRRRADAGYLFWRAARG
jgi:hypothetical protein